MTRSTLSATSGDYQLASFDRVVFYHRIMRALATIIVICVLVLGAVTACDSSRIERERKQAHLGELEELDRFNRSLAPAIPFDQAVGCDVCPGVCTSVDLHPIPMADVLRSFRRHATRSTREFEVWKPLKRLTCIAASLGPEGTQTFLTLLDDDLEPVRYFAARHALDLAMDWDGPVRVLRVVGRGDSPFAYPARVRLMLLDLGGR